MPPGEPHVLSAPMLESPPKSKLSPVSGVLWPVGVWHMNTWNSPALAGAGLQPLAAPRSTPPPRTTAARTDALGDAAARTAQRHAMTKDGTGDRSALASSQKGFSLLQRRQPTEIRPPLRTNQFFQITSGRSTGGHRAAAARSVQRREMPRDAGRRGLCAIHRRRTERASTRRVDTPQEQLPDCCR